MATGEREKIAPRCFLSHRFRIYGTLFWAAVRPGRELSGDYFSEAFLFWRCLVAGLYAESSRWQWVAGGNGAVLYHFP